MAVWMFSALPASAQAPPAAQSEKVAAEAISQLRSPYCPGLMLEVCPSLPAEMLRDSIRALAAEGARRDEIVEWVLARHGEEWRAVPKRSGTGMWAWVIPPLVLLAGAGLVLAKLRRLTRSPGAAAVPEPELSPGERERLAAALKEWEHSAAGGA
jgi:cytochrome c-type biogenesis protein CcmH/NrfF